MGETGMAKRWRTRRSSKPYTAGIPTHSMATVPQTQVILPTVILNHPEDYKYRSILEPQISAEAGECLVGDIASILKASSRPAIRTLLTEIQAWRGEEPHLSHSRPLGFSLPPPTRPDEPAMPPPFSVPEPTAAQFVRRLSNRWANAFNRALFAREGLTREEGIQFERAHFAWRRKLDDHERLMQKYEVQRQDYERRMAMHARDLASWKSQKADHDSAVADLHSRLSEALRAHEALLTAREEARFADVAKLENLFDLAVDGDCDGIQELARQCWLAMPLPADFPRTFAAEYDAEAKILLITIEAPDFARVPLSSPLKTTRKQVGERAIRQAQREVSHCLCLRLIHEVFATPELETVGMVAINVELEHFGKRDGRLRRDVTASVKVTRQEFEPIDIRAVDHKLCFKSLKGVETPSFDDISSVMPLLTFDRSDRRIVAGRDVADALPVSSNLAAMPWEDFEHIVRELFGKMFSERSSDAEVNVTRASRDYGVDALVFDPDPILGGKYVIQAKRYVNTVDVAAVRDLFGTVQNEGASKGFLVTTSSYGPDAHHFAKGKPLVLIDGSQLLGLLSRYGYDFRIDLSQARRQLGLSAKPRGRSHQGRAN